MDKIKEAALKEYPVYIEAGRDVFEIERLAFMKGAEWMKSVDDAIWAEYIRKNG